MLRAGAGMYHVKELLGHESLDTIKHYAPSTSLPSTALGTGRTGKLTITDLKETHRKCHPRERDGSE